MVSSRLFRSRWSALFWAVGVLWTAYDVAEAVHSKPATNAASPAAGQDATGEAISPADLAVLANAGS